jgi:fructokinase
MLGDAGQSMHPRSLSVALDEPYDPPMAPRSDRDLIVVAGEGLVDLIVRPEGQVEAIPGGGPFNAARALGRLGCRVAFLGRLSTDRFGRILRSRLEEDGVDLSLAPTTDDPTLLAIAEVDETGAATYRFHTAGTAAAGLAMADVAGVLPAETRALHVGTLGLLLEPMATTIAGLVGGVRDDVLVIADPNIRPSAIRDEAGYRARLAALTPRVDVVKASVDDLRWIEPSMDAVTAAEQLVASGPAAVLVTDGAGPIRIVGRGGTVVVPVPDVPVVDTVGAGDAFGAGFLAAWIRAGHRRADLSDLDAVAEAVRFGARVGAWTVGRAGADPPTLADLAAEGAMR